MPRLPRTSRTARRRAAAADLLLLLAVLVTVALLCRALGAPVWAALLIGGAVGAVGTRTRTGERRYGHTRQ
ncbi:hypothetical protein ACFWXK_23330 [Streptomyces sp. NPDC059070]|uniref:hypothetical protein n=1 Tax=Streptomyces sp. NPDC059070 TaxID=3346713 RepID=UPI0036A44C1E